jgi:aminopeptidase N
LKQGLAKALSGSLWAVVEANATLGVYRPVAGDIAKRSLRWCALGYLASLRDDKIAHTLTGIFASADNMTDELNALTLLCHYDLPMAGDTLAVFAARWKDEALVMDKWFAIQATRPDPLALASVKRLVEHEQFDLTLPNRVRALLGSFAMGNPVAFHQPDGTGYAFYFGQLAALDRINPQVAARMATVASRLSHLPREQQSSLRTALQKLLDDGCSDNLAEVVGRLLAT